MNRVLIFAGGTGVRMNTNGLPKQFLELFGKPILIHTVNKFEACEQIDDIVIVCLSDWINYTKRLLLRYNIRKVSAVIPGGSTGFASRYLGLQYLCDTSSDPASDIVLIHDGVRPIIDNALIERCLSDTLQKGNAITCSPANETVLLMEGDSVRPLDRSQCVFARAPQAFHLKEIHELYQRAYADERTDLIDSASIAHHYGKALHLIEGDIANIKLTNPKDFFLLHGLMEADEYHDLFLKNPLESRR